MSVETIELIWIAFWLPTFLAFLPMEHWARLTVRDQRASRQGKGPNGTMTSLADWLLWLFRLLPLTALLMLLLVVPALFLPPNEPRPLEHLTEWQRTVAAVGNVSGLVCLFGACGSMLLIGVRTLRIWVGLQKRASGK